MGHEYFNWVQVTIPAGDEETNTWIDDAKKLLEAKTDTEIADFFSDMPWGEGITRDDLMSFIDEFHNLVKDSYNNDRVGVIHHAGQRLFMAGGSQHTMSCDDPTEEFTTVERMWHIVDFLDAEPPLVMWVATISHKYGTDVIVCTSEKAANKAVADFARDWWYDFFDHEPPESDGVAILKYFAAATDDENGEYFEITRCEGVDE